MNMLQVPYLAESSVRAPQRLGLRLQHEPWSLLAVHDVPSKGLDGRLGNRQPPGGGRMTSTRSSS